MTTERQAPIEKESFAEAMEIASKVGLQYDDPAKTFLAGQLAIAKRFPSREFQRGFEARSRACSRAWADPRCAEWIKKWSEGDHIVGLALIYAGAEARMGSEADFEMEGYLRFAEEFRAELEEATN